MTSVRLTAYFAALYVVGSCARKTQDTAWRGTSQLTQLDLFDREIVRALFVTDDFRYRPRRYRNTRQSDIYYDPLATNFLVGEFKLSGYGTSFLGQFRATIDWITDNCEAAQDGPLYAMALCQTATACHDPLAVIAKLGENSKADFRPENLPSAALVAAAASNDLVLASELLLKGVSSNQKFLFLGTPLTVAACCGHKDMVHVLLRYRTENVLDSLTAASAHGHSAIVEALLPNLGSNHDERHVERPFRAAIRGGHERCWRLLSECNRLTNMLEQQIFLRKFSLLHDAAECGHNTLVQLALDQGEDVNAMGGINFWELFDPLDNSAPLWALVGATFNDHAHTVKLLLDRGANMANHGQGLPLAHAASNGNQEIVQMLLAKGTPVNVNGSAAMLHAVTGGQIFMMRFLASYGGVALDNMLFYAVHTGLAPVVRVLIEELGVDPNYSLDGRVAIREAKSQGQDHIVQLLKDLGAVDPEPEIPVFMIPDRVWTCACCIKDPETGGTIQMFCWRSRKTRQEEARPPFSFGLHNVIP
ncbi:ankyrin [Aulographum hederae CBS 113979]|uniref:Ankyrin n=1 Tax=Aulographum hederae CBS 113979 TaxID=1176131 RepID=A0A6G1GVA6_9PEZI|nr:ankyrin [Aulographum hederae CBS 113979]